MKPRNDGAASGAGRIAPETAPGRTGGAGGTAGPAVGRRLAEMTWPEVADAVRSGAETVILPLGATEQHGPHLPLGTDTFRASALAERLAERLADRTSERPEAGFLVAPALPFGCSDEHSGFPGLLGLDHETLARVILDLARRLRGWGVRRLVLLSAHGGNGEALELALDLVRRELPDLAVRTNGHLETIVPALLEAARRDGIPANDLGLHAGEGETSEMLHLRPDLVRADASEPGYTGDMETVVDGLRDGGLRTVTENGVLGDPTRAEADRGDRYLDAAAEDLAALLREAGES